MSSVFQRGSDLFENAKWKDTSPMVEEWTGIRRVQRFDDIYSPGLHSGEKIDGWSYEETLQSFSPCKPIYPETIPPPFPILFNSICAQS
jgi:hypothetical protein